MNAIQLMFVVKLFSFGTCNLIDNFFSWTGVTDLDVFQHPHLSAKPAWELSNVQIQTSQLEILLHLHQVQDVMWLHVTMRVISKEMASYLSKETLALSFIFRAILFVLSNETSRKLMCIHWSIVRWLCYDINNQNAITSW
jgi:hypothetical protein